MRPCVLLLAVLALLADLLPAQAWEQKMVAVSVNGEAVQLSTIIYRPATRGPFPTLVFLHGSTGFGGDSERFAWTQEFAAISRYFVERGWAVILPSRRGRGGSEGLYDEGFSEPRALGYSCNPDLSLPGAERALRDVAAIMDVVRTWSFVDQDRIVIGGASRGGILAAVYAGEHPRTVRGVINVVGGWAGQCPQATEMNQRLFRRAAAYLTPMLWLYSDRDWAYTLDQVRASLSEFRRAGGQAIFHDEFSVGHGLSSYPKLWQPAIGNYLSTLGLPTDPSFREETPLVPDPAVLPQRFLGRWAGAWFGVVPTVVTVRDVASDGTADVLYFVEYGSRFVTGRIADGVLRLADERGEVRFFHMPDGRLRGEVETVDGSVGTAILEPRP